LKVVLLRSNEVHVVTGAFGYSGRYIAARLIEAGYRVRTLTNSPNRLHLFEDRLETHPFHFDQPELLEASLEGASVLYNTYWVRFNYGSFSYAQAIENSQTLFRAARAAGVERVVHVSITNPSEDSPFEYFRGKAQVERALRESGLSYAILRPALLFGGEGILINNIAWALRHLPVFGVFGSGDYHVQPICVDDLAELALIQGKERTTTLIDAIGPETFTYRELVYEIERAIGVRRPIISVPARIGYLSGWILGKMIGDIVITWDEVRGLMQGLLATQSPPVGRTKFSSWAREHAESLGKRYENELFRRMQQRLA
jgi:NADH dehydrogenase